MKKEIPFYKYTSFGNNFVIIDETIKPILTETEKSNFAFQATNVNFGIGCDNMLVIQPFTPEILWEINNARHYWNQYPDSISTDYIFRMFEPDGVEAFSCANGLMCIANHLNTEHGIRSARIATEIPTGRPRAISIGAYLEKGTTWINLGHPRRIPPEILQPAVATPYDGAIDFIENIRISFREHDLAPFSHGQTLELSGYLTFTGEPHLVVFPETGFSLPELAKTIFIASSQDDAKIEKAEKRVAFGSWLVHHIGTYLNKKCSHLFPAGINVNFAHIISKAGTLEYRCFERGIYRETLACGTGALAVALVAQRLNLIKSNKIMAWPHKCRWHDPAAQILLEENESGWMLHGSPVRLFEGSFRLWQTLEEQKVCSGLKSLLNRAGVEAADGVDFNPAVIH